MHIAASNFKEAKQHRGVPSHGRVYFHGRSAACRIEPGNSALDIGQFEAFLTMEQSDQQAGLRVALEDIDAIVARQQESMRKLPRAREWRLTMDNYTFDSSRKKTFMAV